MKYQVGEQTNIPTVSNNTCNNTTTGSILLLADEHNQPLGFRNIKPRISASSGQSRVSSAVRNAKKLTKDGKTVLEPQPDDSHNDPLNWPKWRRNSVLISLGLYCMLGGGMTPVLAAGFTNVATTYGITTARVSLTTGLYMMGLGVGSVLSAPTAILFGKRPVYLISAITFILTAVWCALSPNFVSLLVARIFQGIALSPVECLPSATIAEIFFLHERAYRIGIYTLLLLGGKNLIPLLSAAIIQSLNWRWVFWWVYCIFELDLTSLISNRVVAFIGVFCWWLLFLFVPETFRDRTPGPNSSSTRSRIVSEESNLRQQMRSHMPITSPPGNVNHILEENVR